VLDHLAQHDRVIVLGHLRAERLAGVRQVDLEADAAAELDRLGGDVQPVAVHLAVFDQVLEHPAVADAQLQHAAARRDQAGQGLRPRQPGGGQAGLVTAQLGVPVGLVVGLADAGRLRVNEQTARLAIPVGEPQIGGKTTQKVHGGWLVVGGEKALLALGCWLLAKSE
jgi:hypothetical protein